MRKSRFTEHQIIALLNEVEQGAEILCLIRFTQCPTGGPQLPVRGRVVRSEIRTLGICDLAVEFTRPLLEELG